MTPSPHSGGGFSRRSKRCSSRYCCWRARWGCSRWARWHWDGTKIHANASRHSALSYEHAGTQLKAEVADLLAKAEAADQADVPDGMSIPEELERRKVRLEKVAAGRAALEGLAE